ELRLKYFGRKSGVLNDILKSLKDMPEEKKKEIGKFANELKIYFENELDIKKNEFLHSGIKEREKKEKIDITAPGKKVFRGHIHPLTHVMRKSVSIFESMGFEIASGPEVETEFYNFDALNIPASHPSRDMQDTFWIDVPGLLMRTQTSSVQVRFMEKHNPPLRIVCPGRVFRKEATDATHEMQFYQLECLAVAENLSLVNLKSVLELFFKKLLENEKIKVRFRPSFFPFVEPGVEVDVLCFKCSGAGCALCKRTGWIEVGGAGMVHPNVLKTVKIDPSKYRGFAFGMGLDRIAMIRYGIDDVRLFYGTDMRFLKQF
ncbi:phenylalanine--tRNA ligase subunit alpha, partial [Candidatus Azambacteria bacterium]|nr:phenylalanine--tRNA ligase subunit alpha [Candidatus Azambacteria bacterium]